MKMMETLQIRLPKRLLDQIDSLIKSDLFRNRSEIIRLAIQDYFQRCNFNGAIPFIVGPYKNPDFREQFDRPPETNDATPDQIELAKKILKDLRAE